MASFTQPIVLGSSILLYVLKNMFLIFLGVSLHHYWGLLGSGTLLLLSHSTSIYTKFQLHPKYLLKLLFLKVLYIKVPECIAVLIYFSSHLDLLNIFNCACTTLFRN